MSLMGVWDQGATLTSLFLLCPKEVRAAPAMAEGQLGEGHGANLCQAGSEGKAWATKPAAAADQLPGLAEGGVV